MALFKVTVRHPLGGERTAEFEATSEKTAPIVARGVARTWAEQVVLESVRPADEKEVRT